MLVTGSCAVDDVRLIIVLRVAPGHVAAGTGGGLECARDTSLPVQSTSHHMLQCSAVS